MIKITCTSTDNSGKEIITRNYMIRTDEPHAIEFDSFIEDSINYERESRHAEIEKNIDWKHERDMEIEADHYEEPVEWTE